MSTQTLADALEREHHEIDAGVEAFLASLAGGTPDAEPLRRAMAALRRHIFLEEEQLFPPLREAGMVAPVFVMLREHGEMWQAMDALGAELDGNADPGVLAASCQDLLGLLGRHNAKEEAILYPQADAALGAPAAAELQGLLDGGVLPEGWICSGARART